MGRLLKRVPMDFHYPLNKKWEGYVNPHYKKCPNCEAGWSKEYKTIESILHRMFNDPECLGMESREAMVWNVEFYASLILKGVKGEGDERYINVANEINSWLKEKISNPDLLTFKDLARELVGREPSGVLKKYSTSDVFRALNKMTKVSSLEEDWYKCPTCEGDGLDPEVKEAHESWEKYEPPTGDGFQLWENTSEGSPVSPVFQTLKTLCEWAEKNATTFASFKATKEEWIKMLTDDAEYFQDLKTGEINFESR